MTAAMIRSTPKAISTHLGHPSANIAMNSCCRPATRNIAPISTPTVVIDAWSN
jgi:hypothetical protein